MGAAVGNLAEKKIPGFAISETSFFIFIVMASRRIEADRFLTQDFNEHVYSKEGFAWVTQTKSFRDVLKRHYPKLDSELPEGVSAFTPYEVMPFTGVGNGQ
jgi:alpha-dioxygenase